MAKAFAVERAGEIVGVRTTAGRHYEFALYNVDKGKVVAYRRTKELAHAAAAGEFKGRPIEVLPVRWVESSS
jgi:hypothetical protein